MLVGLVLLVVARVAFWQILPTANEDAYIAFRYARHLTEGHGLVFNLGERIMGFTSILWTLWTALGIALVHDPVLWTRASALVLDGVTLAAAVRLLEASAGRAAAWCFAAYFAVWPFFGALAASGLEMNLLMALMLSSAYGSYRRTWWSGLTLGALALVRPEGLLVAAVLALWATPRARWTALAISGVGAGLLWLYYGSPLPQSVTAKASVYGMPGPWQARYWWEWLLPADLWQVPSQQETIQLWSLRVLMVPAAAAGLWRLRRAPAAAPGWAALGVLAAYAIPGVPFFYWYFSVPAVGVGYLACAGLPAIVRGPWVYVSVALLMLGCWTIAPERSYRPRARAEVLLFGSIGGELARVAQPGQSVLLEPLGWIAWRNGGLRVLDEVGLVAPAVAKRRTQGAGWYADVVQELRPDWLVVRADLLSTQRAFGGGGAPFRDSTDVRRCFASYQPVFQTADPPGPTDLVLLQRVR